MTCLSPCSDFLVIAAAALGAFLGLIAYWSGRFDRACRCPIRAKCSHRERRKK